MYAEEEDVYYYITVLNENYQHPEMPEGCEEGIRKGMYLLRDGAQRKKGKREREKGYGPADGVGRDSARGDWPVLKSWKSSSTWLPISGR